MLKKSMVSVMVLCLLGQNLAFAASKSANQSLRQVQLQARQDFKVFQAKYGKQSQELLPAVMATAPLILIKSADLQALKEELALLQQEASNYQSVIEAVKNSRTEEINRLKADNKALSEENALQARRLSRYENNILYSNTISSLEDERFKLLRINKQLEEELATALHNMEAYRQELMRLQKLISGAEDETVQALTGEIASVRAQFAQAQSTVKEVTGKLVTANQTETAAVTREIAQVTQKPLATFEKFAGNMSPSDLSYYLGAYYDTTLPVNHAKIEHEQAFWSAFESGNLQKADLVNLPYLGKKSINKLSENQASALLKVSKLYKQEGAYTINFFKEAEVWLMYFAKSPQAIRAVTYMIKHMLTKSGLLGVGLLTIGIIACTAAPEVSAKNMAVARRIAINPELFLYADDKHLSIIENDELANNTAREIAETLHAAKELSQEDMDFVMQNFKQQDLQKKEVKKAITGSVRTVRAR